MTFNRLPISMLSDDELLRIMHNHDNLAVREIADRVERMIDRAKPRPVELPDGFASGKEIVI